MWLSQITESMCVGFNGLFLFILYLCTDFFSPINLQGICDNLLTCILRAWDLTKPILFCPAMNTKMYEHPITKVHMNTLKSWGYEEVPCVSKTLMCGDTGLGAMAEVATIIAEVRKRIVRATLL